MLKKFSTDIASRIPDGSMIIEIASGLVRPNVMWRIWHSNVQPSNPRKVCLLLQALEKSGKSIDYYLLDLNEKLLQYSLSLMPRFKNISCRGVLGSGNDGIEWLKRFGAIDRRPRCVLQLGSGIG